MLHYLPTIEYAVVGDYRLQYHLSGIDTDLPILITCFGQRKNSWQCGLRAERREI